MQAAIAKYLSEIAAAYRRGNATEHTYRPALKALLEALDPSVVATNEPRRVECGAPDLVVNRRADGLVVGHVEAKDIGVSLDEAAKSEQLRKRYLPALSSLLLTDYVEFRWYVDGKERSRFRLAALTARGPFAADDSGVRSCEQVLGAFLQRAPVQIVSAEELARRLAPLTRLIRDTIVAAFRVGSASVLLREWREMFAETLLPELAREGGEVEFADMFAQTLSYGLFSARALTPSARRFTLVEAAKLIPRTNPFLRDFFDLVTGPKLDDEPFAGYVQDLVTLLDAADLAAILEDFGKGVSGGRRRDPVVHFYETFLSAYEPRLRELRGVYYTPEPVVSYIVESIDWVLRDKFDLADGLADKSKVKILHEQDGQTVEDETHRVQILDPAAGTGTFLFEVVEHIRAQFERKHQAGAWPGYVHEHLLPRLFGFEILMAPYAVAHLKLGLELSARHLPELFRARWAYEFHSGERLNVYLTNTLDDIETVARHRGPLAMLSTEANEAIAVKRRRPVLVVLGNPPYANFGRQNRSRLILDLLGDYKRGLHEKKLNLDDDFIKFLRWAQWRIDRTGSGVIGFITNNVYIDGLTHRRMRESLLEDFDEIYILNLHGSSKKQEKAPDGSKDDNVFDITIGVAIALFVKLPPAVRPSRGKKEEDGTRKKLATVHHADLWGPRKTKYEWLEGHDAKSTGWTTFTPGKPDYFFRPRNTKHEREWNAGWSLPQAFPLNNNGLKTDRDDLFLDFERSALVKRMQVFFSEDPPADFLRRFRIEDSTSYDIESRRKRARWSAKAVQRCLYRPFDVRWLYYDVGLTSRPAARVMKHLIDGGNLAFITTRQTKEDFGILATDMIAGHKSCAGYDINTVFPLYLAEKGDALQAVLVPHENGHRPNMAAKFVDALVKTLSMRFIPDGRGDLKKTFGPEDVFNYIYAVLHAPGYRTRYGDFLKLDFPRIPLTTDRGLFRRLCDLGAKLVGLHTLREHGPDIVSFDVAGTNLVEEVLYVPPAPKGSERAEDGAYGAGRTGRVYVNEVQYFEGVPPQLWEFRIGGYKVAEKWLKDREGRELTHDDLEHYQRTIGGLAETREVMSAIDAIIADHGGWPLT